MKTVLFAFALCTVPLAARAHEGGHDVRGEVSAVSAEELTIKTGHGEEKFALTPATELVKDGAPATARELKPRARAVVHGKKRNGRMEAIKVQFSSPPK